KKGAEEKSNSRGVEMVKDGERLKWSESIRRKEGKDIAVKVGGVEGVIVIEGREGERRAVVKKENIC
ncbi:hypothetical protein, partial [Shigella flexneri]|uniref:hypothetical protein n=1 Tax=Shigella flexneri TaxID=623 RepID=UPI001493CD02